MKKILMLLMIVLLVLMVGCGEKTTTIETDDGDVEVTVNEGNDTTTIEVEDTTVEVSQDLKVSVDVPNTYPDDLLPLYKDMFVAVAMENQDGSISLVGMTEDELDEVVDFYEKITEDYNVMMKERSADSYMKMGDYEGMTYTISVVPDDSEEDYETAITLMVIPGELGSMDMTTPEDSGEATDTESDDSSEAMDMNVELDFNDMSIPESYPDKILPIMNNKDTKIMMSNASGTDLMIGFMTKDEIDDVVKFYEDKLKKAEDLSYMEMGPNKMLTGTIDEHRFEMVITENSQAIGEDPAYKTLIQIMYSKVE